LLAQLVGGLNTLDGFSLTAPAISENSDTKGPLDLDNVDPAALDGGTTGFAKLPNSDGGFPGALSPRIKVCLSCASSTLSDGGTAVFFPTAERSAPRRSSFSTSPAAAGREDQLRGLDHHSTDRHQGPQGHRCSGVCLAAQARTA